MRAVNSNYKTTGCKTKTVRWKKQKWCMEFITSHILLWSIVNKMRWLVTLYVMSSYNTIMTLKQNTQKRQRNEMKLPLIFKMSLFHFFHWKIAFQMPASLRKCKMQIFWTAPSVSWNRTRQKIFTSAKHNPAQPPVSRLITDWPVPSFSHWSEPFVLWWGDSASLCLANSLQGMCRAESCPW